MNESDLCSDVHYLGSSENSFIFHHACDNQSTTKLYT